MTKALTRGLLLLAALACLSSASAAKDRVLLVGIDDYQDGHIKKLTGCENDTKLLREFLTSKLGFDNRDIHDLVNRRATEQNIRNEVRDWLIGGTRPGDRVFFAYSGHGTRVEDSSGDEPDGMDEALVAYDVKVKQPFVFGKPATPTGGYILDDDISQWITSLYGRQVVMLFDSCHSGTISRGVGGETAEGDSRFLTFEDEQVPRGKENVYSPDYGKGTLSRDMTTTTESFLDKAVNGVVVVSAAKADQEAFSIRVDEHGRKQGALTYLFVKRQQDALIPVGKLQEVLAADMQALARARLLSKGRNGEYQVPQVEIHAQRTSLPIFGGTDDAAWTAAPEVALHNPLSETKVEIWTADNRRDFSITKLDDKGQPGESIPLTVRTSSAGYLYLWVFSKDDEAKCLFPSKYDRQNFVKAEKKYTFPRCRDGLETCQPSQMYEFFASEPEGRDVWVALVTDEPLALREDGYSYRWADAFNIIGLSSVQNALTKYAQQALTRGVGTRPAVKPTVNAWQAGVVVLNTHR